MAVLCGSPTPRGVLSGFYFLFPFFFGREKEVGARRKRGRVCGIGGGGGSLGGWLRYSRRFPEERGLTQAQAPVAAVCAFRVNRRLFVGPPPPPPLEKP